MFLLPDGKPLIGEVFVRVLPPQDLNFPILPYRSDISKKVSLPLCKICADQQCVQKCRHSAAERSWFAVYTTEEINYAMCLGYEILTMYEAYVFKKQGKPFEKYIKTLAYIKIKV